MSSVVISGDISGTVTLDAPATAGTTVLTLPATSGTVLTSASATVGANGITFSDGSTQTAAASPFGLKNRIINGDMVIDQRNAGAAVSLSNTSAYTIDRFIAYNVSDGVISVQQTSIAPTGFINSMRTTVTTADASVSAGQYSFFRQNIEGFNVADLGWGTASAQTVTLSFWVRSSVTGTFGGSIQNSAEDRAYAFTYTINSANTWEKETITIPGDTTGTWLTTNGVGLRLNFSLGVGSTFSSTANTWVAQTSFNATGSVALLNTLNATFFITGVQLERNTTATPFEWLPISTELMLCQRYYYKQQATALNDDFGVGYISSTTAGTILSNFPVSMRVAPSALEQSGTASNYQTLSGSGGGITCSAVPVLGVASTWGARTSVTVASGLTTGQAIILRANSTNSAYLAWSAEL